MARRLASRAMFGAMREVPGHPPLPDRVTVGQLVPLILHGVASMLVGLVQLALAVALFAACALFIWYLL